MNYRALAPEAFLAHPEPTPWFLVGMTGLAGAGKDMAAGVLVANGYQAIAFADRLREQVARAWGVSESVLTEPSTKHLLMPSMAFVRCNDAYFRAWSFMRGHNAEKPRTPRSVMQAWGDFVRSVDPLHYVRVVDHWILDRLRAGHRHLVVTDVRLEAEANLIKHRGGVLLRVHRPDLHSSDTHCTEQPDTLPFDGSVLNNGSVHRLHGHVLDSVGALLGYQARKVGE